MLGPLIASAFLATLMGVGSANIVFLPMANRLKELSEKEMHFREMTLEGILGIQAGDNPRVIAGEAHVLRRAGRSPEGRRVLRRRRGAEGSGLRH